MGKTTRNTDRLDPRIVEAYHRGYADGQRQATLASLNDYELAIEDILSLLQKGNGYFRLGYGHDKRYWVRWKWTDGDFRDHYQFGSSEDFTTAIRACVSNCVSVLSGKGKALRDNGYRNKR